MKTKEKKKFQETKLHAIPRLPVESFAVHIGDHLRFGIICNPSWGSFPVWESFAVGDHLRRYVQSTLEVVFASCPGKHRELYVHNAF